MSLIPKGGLSIAGRKIPWEAIAALAGVAGVILVIRARHQGQNVASVGQAPAATFTAADTGFGANGFSPDISGALANITQQLAGLQQSGINSPTQSSPAPSAEMAVLRSFGALAGTPFGGWDTSGQSGPPAYTNAQGAGTPIDLPFGSSWQVLGMSPSGLVELLGPTGDVWINPRDISGYTGTPTALNPGASPINGIVTPLPSGLGAHGGG